MDNSSTKSSYLIGIVGPSGAGKSTLCKTLKESSDEVEHIKLDNYFKSPETFPKKLGFLNWELPSNLKFEDLVSDLKTLGNGEVVETKTFPKRKGAKPEPLTLRPLKYILVEGFMLFKNKELREMLDLKIYLDIPEDLMLERRKIRFGEEHINAYDTKVAIPEFIKYGTTQKAFADVVIDASQAQQKVIAEVQRAIQTLT